MAIMTSKNFDFSLSIEKILDQIAERGYAIVENAIDKESIDALLAQAQSEHSEFVTAKIGRQSQLTEATSIRSDKTKWFNGSSLAERAYLDKMEQLRCLINRHFYLGLFDYECHFARYNKGDFYKKHLDAFKGRSNRVFTTVLYLNTPETGGELGIYCDDKGELIEKIPPRAGTLVCFESERFPHQVFTASDVRYSIAGWFRKNNSISGVVDPSS